MHSRETSGAIARCGPVRGFPDPAAALIHPPDTMAPKARLDTGSLAPTSLDQGFSP